MFTNSCNRTPWFKLVIILIISLALSSCGGDTATETQTEAESEAFQIGVVMGRDIFSNVVDGLKAELAEQGYVEGETVTYIVQSGNGDRAAMIDITEEFVNQQMDAIVTTTTAGVLAAQEGTQGTEIPVIFTMVADPEQAGVVNSLREPGGNITGVRNPPLDYLGKRVDFLVQMDPTVERVWLPHDPGYTSVEVRLAAIREAVETLEGVELVETNVTSPDELIAELESLAAAEEIGFDAIYIMPDNVVQDAASLDALFAFADEHNLPLVANVESQVERGALFSYMPDNEEIGRDAAPMVIKVLRGTDPGTIPVAFAEPRLVVNAQIAESLGLTLNEGLMAQAFKVIR